MSLTIIPLRLEEANALVAHWHRHHAEVPGAKFCIGVVDDERVGSAIIERVCGAAIVGRPVARMLDDGMTLEVNRVATDGTKNACSALYGACRRAAFALGYSRLITYTLPAEGGASLRGAGWKLLGERGGGQWGNEKRPRVDRSELLAGQKLLWEAQA